MLKDRRAPQEQGSSHQANFIDAMRSRNVGDVNAEILDGHHSAALSHMASVSHRLGRESNAKAMLAGSRGNPHWSDACERLALHLTAHGIDLAKTPTTLGPWVSLDPNTERFVGDRAQQANALSRRDYRETFVVPEIG